MRIWLYTLEVFVFHAYKRIVGAISKHKFMQYICICIHIMRMYLPIGHRRNARPHEADRQSNHLESAAEPM